MPKLLSQNRVTIPAYLFSSLNLGEAKYLKVYFLERTRTIMFSTDKRNGDYIFIGEVHIDSKNRILFPKGLVDLINQLLASTDFSSLYLYLDEEEHLCMKRVPY